MIAVIILQLRTKDESQKNSLFEPKNDQKNVSEQAIMLLMALALIMVLAALLQKVDNVTLD